jgi:ribosome biogenesis GTPase A
MFCIPAHMEALMATIVEIATRRASATRCRLERQKDVVIKILDIFVTRASRNNS